MLAVMDVAVVLDHRFVQLLDCVTMATIRVGRQPVEVMLTRQADHMVAAVHLLNRCPALRAWHGMRLQAAEHRSGGWVLCEHRIDESVKCAAL